MKHFLFLIYSLLVTQALQAQAPGKAVVSFPVHTTVLPITYRSNANPLIPVFINGKGPYRFMFDTGSPGLIKLDQRVFDDLHLAVIDSVLAGDGSGRGNRSFPLTVINNLTMGEFTIYNGSAMVRNYNSRAGIDSIDGVIGLAFFDEVIVELNFENDQLIISKGKLVTGGAGVYPSPYNNGVPGIALQLGGKNFDAIFDTGNMGGLTVPSNLVTADMMEGEPRVIGRAQTVSNNFEIKEVTLKQPVILGEVRFEKPIVVMNEVLPQTNIGMRMARQMNITFDKTNGLVKLLKYIPASVTNRTDKSTDDNQPINEYTGQYGDRSITAGSDGALYIQRPGGMLLKMKEKSKDEFGLEKVPGAVLVFERNSKGEVTSIKVSRDGTNWETAVKNR